MDDAIKLYSKTKNIVDFPVKECLYVSVDIIAWDYQEKIAFVVKGIKVLLE